MEFSSALIIVSDMAKAKKFYERLLGQKLKFDFGENIMFESGVSIQLKPHFAKMTGISEKLILDNSHNFELYFVEENFDAFLLKLERFPEIVYVQRLVEHSWGQRVTRFYDPDGHIIEVGESMESVVRKLLLQGMTVEETAKKTQHPIKYVLSCMNERME